MKKYSTVGCRAIMAEGFKEAAEVFANRIARREFGKRGYARTCNQNSFSASGRFAAYNAFIGYPTNPGETSGYNINFIVNIINFEE